MQAYEPYKPKTDKEHQVASFLGRQVRKLRNQQGLTRSQLAKVMECTPEELACIERGEICIHGMYLVKLSRTFEVPVKYWVDPRDLNKDRP